MFFQLFSHGTKDASSVTNAVKVSTLAIAAKDLTRKSIALLTTLRNSVLRDTVSVKALAVFKAKTSLMGN